MGIREDYQAMMEKQLKDWDAQGAHLKAGATQIEAHAKAEYEKSLETLRTAQTEAWEYFHKVRDANESAWAQFKTHMDDAASGFKSAVERATASSRQ